MEKEIESLVEILEAQEKPYLAQAIQSHAHLSIKDYSHELYSYKPILPLEQALDEAFQEELSRLGYPTEESSNIREYIARSRVIQTAPHLGISHTSRMFCIDSISNSSLGKKDYYIVAMFSGVPFSNLTRPGCIHYGATTKLEALIKLPKDLEREQIISTETRSAQTVSEVKKISFIPSSMQDALVYRSTISPKAHVLAQYFTDTAKSVFALPNNKTSFSIWALENHKRIAKHMFPHTTSVYVDINEVIMSYIKKVLENDSHPITKILLQEEYQEQIMRAFGEKVCLFYGKSNSKNSKLETFTLHKGFIQSKSTVIKLTKENLLEAFKSRDLCPGTLLVFTILSLLNHFKCLGSFRQVEYLSKYKEEWQKLGLFIEYKPEKVPTDNLTTGMFTKQPNLHPIDILLGSENKSQSSDLFGEYLLTMKEVLMS
jgi:hypothetical protein